MKRMVLESEKVTVALYYGLISLACLFVLSTGTSVIMSNNTRGATSTAIGETANFERSQAVATIKNYYTDKKKDVLIAQIGLKDNPVSPMPYQAKDYYVMNQSKEDINAYFGRYGTDGDLFVIIPYPKDGETYEISISNKQFLGVTTETNSDTDLQELTGSVTNQLSNISAMGQKKDGIDSSKNALTDTILFQMTITPKMKDKEYRVKEIRTRNGSLLRKQDGVTKFDFKTYWNEVYRQPKIVTAEKKLKSSVERVAELNDLYTKAKDRFDKNPEDVSAKDQMSQFESLISDEETRQELLSERLVSYRNLKFNSDNFSDFTTKIYGKVE